MEVILLGPEQRKKEIKYGKQDIMSIIQLRHKETTLESIQQMYVCLFQI